MLMRKGTTPNPITNKRTNTMKTNIKNAVSKLVGKKIAAADKPAVKAAIKEEARKAVTVWNESKKLDIAQDISTLQDMKQAVEDFRSALYAKVKGLTEGMSKAAKQKLAGEVRDLCTKKFGMDAQRASELLCSVGLRTREYGAKGDKIDDAIIKAILATAVEGCSDKQWLVSTAIRRASDLARKNEAYTTKAKPQGAKKAK